MPLNDGYGGGDGDGDGEERGAGGGDPYAGGDCYIEDMLKL